MRSVADKMCIKHNAGEIISINRSVDQTLKNIIKLQMMLQFKLDKLHEIFLLANAEEDGGAIAGMTANGGIAEATSSCCATEAAKKAAASFVKMQSVFACKKGKFLSHAGIRGCVTNPNDSYYRGAACVAFSISTYHPSEQAYYEEHGEKILRMMRENPVICSKTLVRQRYNPKWIWKNQIEPLLEGV